MKYVSCGKHTVCLIYSNDLCLLIRGLDEDWTDYFFKSQMGNISDIMGHLVCRIHSTLQSVKRVKREKAAVDSMEMNGCSCDPVRLYFQKQALGQIGPQAP